MRQSSSAPRNNTHDFEPHAGDEQKDRRHDNAYRDNACQKLPVDDRIPVDGLREELAQGTFVTLSVDGIESQYEPDQGTEEGHELHQGEDDAP